MNISISHVCNAVLLECAIVTRLKLSRDIWRWLPLHKRHFTTINHCIATVNRVIWHIWKWNTICKFLFIVCWYFWVFIPSSYVFLMHSVPKSEYTKSCRTLFDIFYDNCVQLMSLFNNLSIINLIAWQKHIHPVFQRQDGDLSIKPLKA